MKKIAALTLAVLGISVAVSFFWARPKVAQAQTVAPPAANEMSQLKAAGLMQVGDQPQSATDIQELYTIFAATVAAVQSVPASPNAGAQKRAIDNQLRQELDSFATNNPASAWTPSINILLGRRDELRSAYSAALAHYTTAFQSLESSSDPTGRALLREASGGLARLLVLTGQVTEFDDLWSKISELGIPMTLELRSARELRQWVHKHPEESYKCGLYCLDQLGRLTQPGHFLPKTVTENPQASTALPQQTC